MWAPLWRACCRAAGATPVGRRGGAGRPTARARERRAPAGRRGKRAARGGRAQRRARPRRFCLPRSWGLQEAPVVLVLRGLQVSASPQGHGLRFSFLQPGREDSPRRWLQLRKAIPSPQCMGRLAVQVVRSPRGLGWPGKALGVQLTAARCRRPCWVGWGRGGRLRKARSCRLTCGPDLWGLRRARGWSREVGARAEGSGS